MKIEIDTQKTKEALSGFMHNTAALGKKAAESAKTNMKAAIEKSKNDSEERKFKKLNPLFPDQFKSEDFKLPNIIMIVDDAVRRGIEMCEGAIGWLSNDSGSEVLCLYDEAIEFSGIQFIPAATCDAVYYVDNFNRNRFIRTDCIFSKAHEERLAELEHIAYSLGAKYCSIEITETASDSRSKGIRVSLLESEKGSKGRENAEFSATKGNSDARAGFTEVKFKNNNQLQRPTLKWFAHDDNITHLIEMCCDGNRAVESKILKLSGSSSATMSQKAALAIDGAISKLCSVKGSVSMNAQATKEHSSTLLFYVEF